MAQQPAQDGASGRFGAAQVPYEMRGVAKLAGDQPQEIGMVKPSLQDIRTVLAHDPREAQNPTRVGTAAAKAEAAQDHPRIVNRLPDRTGLGHADDSRRKPGAIGPGD